MTNPIAVQLTDQQKFYLARLEGIQRGLEIAKMTMLEDLARQAQRQQQPKEEKEPSDGD
jgi:hypothetical protein